MALALFDNPALKIAGAMLVPNMGGALNGTMLIRHNLPWFNALAKPSGYSGKALFGLTVPLYAIGGYASYRVWDGLASSGDKRDMGLLALTVFSVRSIVHHAWTPVLFGKRDLKWSLGVIVVLDMLAAANAALFYMVDEQAGFMMAPSLLWLGYATYLNGKLYTGNKENKPLTWYGTEAGAE